MSSATSLNAAESVRPHLPRLRAKVFDALRQFPTGLTDEELMARTGLSPSTCRPRRCELVASGLVIDSGITRPTNSGRDSTVWRVATVEEREAHQAAQSRRESSDLDAEIAELQARLSTLLRKREERQREVTP